MATAFEALALGILKPGLLLALYALVFSFSRSFFRAFSGSTIHERQMFRFVLTKQIPHCSRT
jgi:hypothetical protein